MIFLISWLFVISLTDPTLAVGSCREARLCCPGRDSSCLAQSQSSPINAIIEDVNVRSSSCYCDHACMTLGDCCPDYKSACGVLDCQVSEWNPWSECDVDCGTGTMSRTRTIRQPAQNGGLECPELHQKRGCQGTKCEIRNNDKSQKETALILPALYSRAQNESLDIRKNLRLLYPKDPAKENSNEYCIEFEVVKSRKACDAAGPEWTRHFYQGARVIVHCQEAAMRQHLGWRCHGDGVDEKVTRWTLLSIRNCHGRWVRRNRGPCFRNADFLFV